MDLSAKIIEIKYKPFLCADLKEFVFEELEEALSKNPSFILNVSKRKSIAISWWVSPKRTRSYPYARVYDTLSFSGKKITIIPIVKDEGKEGDRDFLQWDTVSLMSLLGIYVIIGYYVKAERSKSYRHKITKQRFDGGYVKEKIEEILSYQSDALHWNLSQINNTGIIGKNALDAYDSISKELGIEMHSRESIRRRVTELLKGKENFMMLSRDLAKKSQDREAMTIQPKEKLSGVKATLTIKNYLGGYYFFTCDEVSVEKEYIYLIEGKYSKRSMIPSLSDIKDGLLKMILFTNLKEVKIGNVYYMPVSVLKLTSGIKFSVDALRKAQLNILRRLKKEAKENNFHVIINNNDLQKINI